MNLKDDFLSVDTISESIRFDKCRIERPYLTKDEVTGEASQENREVVGEFKCALYENVGIGTVTVETDIDRTPERIFTLHLKKGVDIRAGDYIFIFKNFYLGEENKEQIYIADFPLLLKTHIEVSMIPHMEV